VRLRNSRVPKTNPTTPVRCRQSEQMREASPLKVGIALTAKELLTMDMGVVTFQLVHVARPHRDEFT
jgi:hypothetical protein